MFFFRTGKSPAVALETSQQLAVAAAAAAVAVAVAAAAVAVAAAAAAAGEVGVRYLRLLGNRAILVGFSSAVRGLMVMLTWLIFIFY